VLKSIFAAAVLLAAMATAAQAGPIQTISFSGTTAFGFDGSAQFGVSGRSLANKAYNISISYDPATLTNDTCGASSNNSCQWNFTNVTETVTINSITKSYALTSGTIQFCACGNDSVFISASSGGMQFGLNFTDSNLLFANQVNVNNPMLLLDLANLPVTNANFQTSGLGGNTSFGLVPTAITTNLAAATAVPEPLTLSLFGTGLLLTLVGGRRLRKQRI